MYFSRALLQGLLGPTGGRSLQALGGAASAPPLWVWEALYRLLEQVCAVQASAETHKLWAAELAAKAQRRVERISKKTEWASRLEAAALAEPVVRHTSTCCLLH